MTADYPSYPLEQSHPARCHPKSPFQSGLLLILMGILLAFLLASCAPEQPTDPVAVVQAAYDCLNQGDLDCYFKFISDDVVMHDSGGRAAGSQTIRDDMELNFTPGEIRFELSDLSSNGSDVTYSLEIYEGDKLVRTYFNGLTVVVDGKIIFDGTEEYRRMECNEYPSQRFCPEN